MKVFVPQLLKEQRKMNAFVRQLLKGRRKSNVYYPQLSKERRKLIVFTPQLSEEQGKYNVLYSFWTLSVLSCGLVLACQWGVIGTCSHRVTTNHLLCTGTHEGRRPTRRYRQRKMRLIEGKAKCLHLKSDLESCLSVSGPSSPSFCRGVQAIL